MVVAKSPVDIAVIAKAVELACRAPHCKSPELGAFG